MSRIPLGPRRPARRPSARDGRVPDELAETIAIGQFRRELDGRALRPPPQLIPPIEAAVSPVVPPVALIRRLPRVGCAYDVEVRYEGGVGTIDEGPSWPVPVLAPRRPPLRRPETWLSLSRSGTRDTENLFVSGADGCRTRAKASRLLMLLCTPIIVGQKWPTV
jgi:hypothetical protein